MYMAGTVRMLLAPCLYIGANVDICRMKRYEQLTNWQAALAALHESFCM